MQQKIGIVGSGMAGLAAAWICRQAGHEVTIFESQPRRGMDAHTLDVAHSSGAGWVDVPMRAMSPRAWGNVLALSAQVGVSTFDVDAFVSCSWLDQSTWMRTSRLQLGFGESGIPFVGSLRYLGLDTLRIILGLRRLSACTRELVEADDHEETLASVVTRYGFDPLFFRGLILPVLATICTCRETYLWQWPARDLLLLLHQVLHGPPLLRFKGGTRTLVDALCRDLSFLSGSRVVKVLPDATGVVVENEAGQGGRFDRVILATQANQTPFLDRAIFARELELLGRFEFDSGELIVHHDTRTMPKNREDWTSLNFLMDQDLKQSMFTVWVNPAEPSIAQAKPIFQSWNPIVPLAEDKIVSRVPLQRAVTTLRNREAWQQLKRLHAEPDRRVFFCGSWAAAGVPLLESAVQSAMAVTQQLGMETPWLRGARAQGSDYRPLTQTILGIKR